MAHRYARFYLNGWITDNLGPAGDRRCDRHGGRHKQFNQTTETAVASHVAIISVIAAANKPLGIDATGQAPSVRNELDAVTNIQLHRYNVAMVQFTKDSLAALGKRVVDTRATGHRVFICLIFEDMSDLPLPSLLNEIPTSFALSNDRWPA